ncbi:Ig-like domain-containing protein [Hoeflea sp. AS60]|uniref:Ig-like domain-containing protein n=1 Tax=Hoeflea sp. AS60 TaxID=3135780 RepID=UPI00316BFAAE
MIDATAEAPDTAAAVQGEGQGLPADAAKAESSDRAASDPADVADSWATPSFDLLRVEPDGSTVIAGKAEPGTTLDIMNGETVIASTDVGASGDFAVILDTPLSAGDYQLTLRVVGEDGTVRQSEEVATVSIPEKADGELLAMVSKPGKASRIIAQPTAAATAGPVEVASATAPSSDMKTTDAAAGQPEAAGADPSAENVARTAGKTEMASAVASAGDTPTVSQTPALPEASSLLTTSAPQVADQNEATDPAAASSSEAEPAAEVAMASPEAAAEASKVEIPADASVRVDAVEIEGDKIFIAGSATPGSRVQVAADGVVIGSDTADETGRFIVEATSKLSVGDHIISADLMDAAGENVLLRATVPFNRPEGEAMAAVAPAQPATPDTDTSAGMQTSDVVAAGELILPDIASLSKVREDAFEALSELKKVLSGTEAPEAATVSDALALAVEKLKSAAMADLPAGSSNEAMAIARSMRIQAEAALAALMPKAEGGEATTAAQPNTGNDALVAGDLAKMSEVITQAETALAEPADMAAAAADVGPGIVGSSGEPGEPKTILQAPLASTPGAVIIRRGDTLWQISRRTYGEGVRYTTIYVANRSQILNPDRIKPGQVFSVPEKPLENAEEMHQQLLGKGKNP